jgi:hypothetical protein
MRKKREMEMEAKMGAHGKGKSLGSTGIISEFYQDVEAEISPVLAAQFNYARRVGMVGSRLSFSRCSWSDS